MQSLRYRLWSPPASPLRIEFPSDLAQSLCPEPDQLETSGALYGVRHGRDVHIVAARQGEALEKIGIFIARARGEVFLTEANLNLFEKHQATVALVRAGPKAGFFVREPNGSIQTVRSHQEFSIEDAAPAQVQVGQRHALPSSRSINPAWTAAACFALTLPLLAFFRPASAPGLQVRERSGQLQISWEPGQSALLEINDGARRVAVPVFANQSNLTYARSSAQVDVILTKEHRSTTVRFVAAPR
jgi:hypothetical protein